MEQGSSEPDDPPSDPFDDLLERAARLTPLPRTAAPRVHPGLELWNGRFQVRRRIGAGGMGVVHEAFDRERGGDVALKTLSRMDALGVYRMKNEFRALAEVTHPNLVQLHELFADRDLWLFTMELVHGERFDTWVRPSGILTQTRLRSALPQLVAGVQAIHAAGKLHRDLKPSNVLVTREGRVVILDFGLVADPEPGGAGQTLDAERRSGTPAYMAPEQAAGQPATAASDWYAVGVMIFEALTGNLPFSGRAHAIMERKQVEAVPSVRSMATSAAADLDALCAALLAREPEARPSGDQIAAVVAAGAVAVVSEVAPKQAPRALGLVGRDAELAALRAACAEAEAGKAVVVRISGESGMGKTAVVTAFLDELRASRRAVVLSGRCYERESLPYKAFDRVIDELTRHLRQLREVDAAALIPRDIGALARIFPVLHRVDVIADAPMRPAANDHELRRRAFDAFTELLACIRDRQPLVVHVDDLQWSDDDSLVLLEHLLARPEPVPMLLVIGSHSLGASAPLRARVERAVQANARCVLHEVALGPLAPGATLELARALLGSAAGPQLVQAVATESEGSPFFAGELARHALEIGADADRLSLEQAICSRAAHLGGAAQRLLELLAISGRPTSSRVLARAYGTPEDALRALARLRTAQLVREAGAHVYECYHDRIRVAIAERMPDAEARERHAQLIAALAIDDGADPERLFEHARAAGEHARAGGYAEQAAARAAASLAFERSAALLGHAIELLPTDDIARLNLRERRAEALSLCGRWSDAARAFENASEHSADPARSMHLLRQSALHFLGSGQSLEGLPRLRRVYAAGGIAWPRTRAGALLRSLLRLLWLWLRGAPRPNAPRAAGAALAGADGESIVLERLLEAAGLVPPYDLARGLDFMSAFATRALRRGDTAQVALALAMSATMFAGLRITRRFGCRLLDEACTLARSHDVAHLRSAALTFAASARVLEGRLQDGLALAAEAEAFLQDGGRAHIYGTWTARALQSHALIELGAVGRAAALFEANARLARDVGDDMAMLGGDSVLRYLADDDVPGAHGLIERKQQALAGTEPIGVLHELVHVEKMMCALYEGRGGELPWSASVLGAAAPTFFDAHTLVACCALQAPAAKNRDKQRRVRKVAHRLRTDAHSDPRSAGMIAQLRAALCFMRGDTQATLAELAHAGECYTRAGFALHAAIMRWHAGRLRSDDDAASQAARFMRAQGIVNPAAWAGMLAPGFGGA